MKPTENKKPGFFYGYIIVLVASIINLVGLGTIYTFGVFFEPILDEFGWNRAVTSGAFSVCLAVSGLLAIVMGKLTDRFGPRGVLIVSGLFLGSGFVLMSQIRTIWQIYLFYGLIGIGMGGLFIPPVSTVARWFVKRRALMTSIVVSGLFLGMMIMAPLVTRLIAAYGWRTSYIIIGVINMVFMIVAAKFMRDDPSQMGLAPYGEGEEQKKSLHLKTREFSFQEAIRTRQFWMLCIAYSSFFFCFAAVTVHIVIHATGLGIPAITAANIIAIFGGVSIAGGLVIGYTADRTSNKLALIISCVLLSIALLLLLTANEVWVLYLFAAIFGFAYGGVDILMAPVAAEIFGLSSLGAVLGAAMCIAMLAEAVSPVLIGHMFDISGNYNIAFLICVAVGITGCIAASFLKPLHRDTR